MFCPKGCASLKQFPIFGKSKFHGKSSVCRAALFSGVIKDEEGGEVTVNIGKGSKEY